MRFAMAKLKKRNVERALDNYDLKRWLRQAGDRRHALLIQLKYRLQSLGLSKRALHRALTQLTRKPHVVLDRLPTTVLRCRLERSSSQVRKSSLRYDHRQDRVPSYKRNASPANHREDAKYRRRSDTSRQSDENIENVRSNIATVPFLKGSTSRASRTTGTPEHGLSNWSLKSPLSSNVTTCSVKYAGETSSRIYSLSRRSGQREDPRTERRMTSSKATFGVVKKKESEIKKEISYSRDSGSSSGNVVFDKQTMKVKHEETQRTSTSSKITSLDMPVLESEDSSVTSDVSSSDETVILNRTKFTKKAKTAKKDRTTPVERKSAPIFRVDTDVRHKQVDSPLTLPVKIDITQQRINLETMNLRKDDISSETNIKLAIKRILNEYPYENLVPSKKPKRDSGRSNNNENGNSNNDQAISNIEATVEGEFSKDERGRIRAGEHKKDSKYMPVLLSKKIMLKEGKKKKKVRDKFRVLFGGETSECENEEEHALLASTLEAEESGERRSTDSSNSKTTIYNKIRCKAIHEGDDVTKEDEATVTCNLQKDLKTTEKVNDNLVPVADTEDVRPSTNSRTKGTHAKDSKTTTDTRENEEKEESKKQFLALCQDVTKEIMNIVKKIKNTDMQDIVQSQQENRTACDVENTISANNDVETHEGASTKPRLSSAASEPETMSDIKGDDTSSCDISRSILSSLLTSNDSSTNDKKYVTVDRVSTSTNVSQETSERAIDKEPIIPQQEFVGVMDVSEKKLDADAGDDRSSAADAFNDNVNEIEMGTDIKPRSEHGSATSSLKVPCLSTSTCKTDDLKNHEIARASPKTPDEIITPGNISRNEDNSTSIQPSVVGADVTAHAEPSAQQVARDSSPAVENKTLFVQQQDAQDSTVLDKDKDATKDKSVEKDEDVQFTEEKTAIEKSAESNNTASDASGLGGQSTKALVNDAFSLSERLWKARISRTEYNVLSELSSKIFIDPVTKHISQHRHSAPLASSESAPEAPTNVENTQQNKELLKIKILKMICTCIEQCRIFKEYFIKHSCKQVQQNILQEMFFAVMQMNNIFQLYEVLLNKRCCFSLINYIVDELNCHMLKDHPTTFKEIVTYMILNYSSVLRSSKNTGNDPNTTQTSNAAFAPASNPPPLHTETLNDKRPQFSRNTAYRPHWNPTISNINQQQSSQGAGNIAHPASHPGQPITSEMRNEVPPQNVCNILPASIQSLPKNFSQSITTNNPSMNNIQAQQSSRKSDYGICRSLPNTSNPHFNIRRPGIPQNIVHVTEQQSQICSQYPFNVNSGNALVHPSYTNQNIPPTPQASYIRAVPFVLCTTPRTSLNLTGGTVERNVVFKNPPAYPQMCNPQAFQQIAQRQSENREYTSTTRTLPCHSVPTFKNVTVNAMPPPQYNAPTYTYVPTYQPTSNIQDRNLPSTVSYPVYTLSSAARTNVAQDVPTNRTFVAPNTMLQNVGNPNPQQSVHPLPRSFENASESLAFQSLPSKSLPSKSSTSKPSLQQTTSSTGARKRGKPRKDHTIKTPTTSPQQDVRQGASAVQNVPHRPPYNAAPSTRALQASVSSKQRTAPNLPCNVQREVSSSETTSTQVPPQQPYQIRANNFNLRILTDIQKVILRDQIIKYFNMPMTWRSTLTNEGIDKVTAERIMLRRLYNSLTHYTDKIIEQGNKMFQENQMQSPAAMVRLESTTVNKNKENNSACNEKPGIVVQPFLNNNEGAHNISMPIKSNITKKSKDQESHSTLTTELAVTTKLSSISLQPQKQDRNTGILHSDVRSLPDAQARSKILKAFLQNDKTMQYSSMSRLAADAVETKDVSKSPSANSYGKQPSKKCPTPLLRNILKSSQDRSAIRIVNIEAISEKQLGIAESQIKATVTDNDLLKTKSISRSSVIVQNNNKEGDATSQSPSYNTENQSKEVYNVHDEVASESSNVEVQVCKINSFKIEPDAEDISHASTSSLLKDEPKLSSATKTSMEAQAESRVCDISCKEYTTTETLLESDIKLERCDPIDDQTSDPVADETRDSLDREICVQKSNEKSNSDAQQNEIPHVEKDKVDISQDVLRIINEMKYEPTNIYVSYSSDTDTDSINLCQSPVIEVQDTVELDESLPAREKMRYRETSPFNVPENISNKTKQSNTGTARLDDIARQCGDMEENLSTHSDIKIDEQFLSESDYCERLSTSSVIEHDNMKMENISFENDIFESDCVEYDRVKDDEDCEVVDHMPSILNVTSISISLFEKMDDNDTLSEDDLTLLNGEEKEEALNNSRVPDETEAKKCLRCKGISTVCCGVCLVAYYCSERCSQLHWNTHHYKHCKPHKSFASTDDIL